MTIMEMLARNAQKYPGDIALIELLPSRSLRNEITWQEFDQRANRVANALLARGIKKGDKVIHLMMNSINWLEVYFGIIRTGAWAVPLNFRFTSKDIEYCANIAEAKAMILGEEFTERVEAIRSRLVTIKNYIFVGQNLPQGMKAFEEVLADSHPQPLNIPISDQDECGLYFTSGTTGDPKPILLTHRNMEFTAIVENRHHYQKKDDNFIIIPPLYHAGSKMHWFGSLIVGGRATILREFSPQNLFEAVAKERGTIVWLLVPWLHDIMLAMDSGSLRKDDYDLGCWRLMHMGAQPIPPSLVLRWKKYFPGMQFDNNYGLTETTGPGCVHLGIENERKLGANGKAGFGWKTRIVRDSGEDVAPGEIGELMVKGDGVMKMYYKNPKLTAKTIKDNWLHTGDLARIDSDGFIYVVDRKKDLIITGGENIYPFELEGVIQTHPKVRDVAVIGLPDERLVEIVAAVIKPKPGTVLTEGEINQFCEQNLPKYKRPRRIIFDDVPRNPTGKLEKQKLRQKYSK